MNILLCNHVIFDAFYIKSTFITLIFSDRLTGVKKSFIPNKWFYLELFSGNFFILVHFIWKFLFKKRLDYFIELKCVFVIIYARLDEQTVEVK